jgi:hypothetical protein
MEHRTFWLPKRGSSAAEYEDAASGDSSRGRFAVADGASESSFAAEWARMLVEGFVAQRTPMLGPWSSWLPAVQQRFAATTNSAALSWYSEMKAQMGAQAAFLGLAIGASDEWTGEWQAVTIGDCCLFQVRDDQLRIGVPVENSADFGLQPSLLSSLSGTLPSSVSGERRAAGRWAPGDRFFLMTDALGPWFLRQHERGNQPWSHVERLLSSQAAFAEWVEGLRGRQQIRNDDATLLIVNV